MRKNLKVGELSDEVVCRIMDSEMGLVERLRTLAVGEGSYMVASEGADEIERLRAALEGVVKWADDLRMYSELETVLVPQLQAAKDALEHK